MIHLYPELSTLYHRTLLVSMHPESRISFLEELSKELWKISDNQTRFVKSPAKDWISCSLGKRNKDEQRILAYSCSLENLVANPKLADVADSLFFEIDPQSAAGENFFKLLPSQTLKNKKLVFCFRREFREDSSLHELALDKKILEIAPMALRIMWPNERFLRDALEWVLSF